MAYGFMSPWVSYFAKWFSVSALNSLSRDCAVPFIYIFHVNSL